MRVPRRRIRLNKGKIYESAGGGHRIITMLTFSEVFYIQLKGRHKGVGGHCSVRNFKQWVYKEVTG